MEYSYSTKSLYLNLYNFYLWFWFIIIPKPQRDINSPGSIRASTNFVRGYKRYCCRTAFLPVVLRLLSAGFYYLDSCLQSPQTWREFLQKKRNYIIGFLLLNFMQCCRNSTIIKVKLLMTTVCNIFYQRQNMYSEILGG